MDLPPASNSGTYRKFPTENVIILLVSVTRWGVGPMFIYIYIYMCIFVKELLHIPLSEFISSNLMPLSLAGLGALGVRDFHGPELWGRCFLNPWFWGNSRHKHAAIVDMIICPKAFYDVISQMNDGFLEHNFNDSNCY